MKSAFHSAILEAELFEAPEEFVARVNALPPAANPVRIAKDPHLDLSWFTLLAETSMPQEARLALLCCGGAWLPMMYRPDSGGRLESLANFYSPLFGLVNGQAVAPDALVSRFRAWRECSELVELRFAPMDPQGRDFQILAACLKKAGWWVSDYFCFGNWYHRIADGGWSTYLATRPGRVRTTLARAERRLSKSGFNIEIFKDDDARLTLAIDAFVAVYTTSWKSPEPFPAFIPKLCRTYARRGELRLGVLWVGQQPVAVQIWLLAESAAYIVKLAYDPSFAHFSPGSVLTAAMCRSAIEKDGVSVIDYLMGDDPYKADWMTERRERRGLIAFNPGSIRGLWRGLKHFAGVRLRGAGN